MRDVSKILARWTIRFEATNRYINLLFRFVWLAMFCKVFEMKPIGYIISGLVVVVLFISISWILDRLKMIDRLNEANWDKTPQVRRIMEDIKHD